MHPCQQCGACCATWQVEIEAGEHGAALADHVVPDGPGGGLVLRGTEGRSPRCDALVGVVGDRVRCTLYADRPSACREVGASWEHGERDPWCDRARARHGLPRLTPADWR